MRNYLCWDPARVYEAVNIDADAVPDPVFWAVDSEMPLLFREGGSADLARIGTDDLVERLLDPRRRHYQLAVLGPAGAGKSHLIHRLRQRLRGRAGIEVLSIRRLETNLRAVLDRLVDRLPPDQQAAYRAELDRAGPSLASPAVQMETLLDSLARAIQEDQVNPQSGIDPELEAELISRLPAYFGDPYLRRERFLAAGEVVPELVDRLFSNRSGKRVEERVRFESANLPGKGSDVLKCSLPARDAIEIFDTDVEVTVPAALAVINRNLDRAIARALNFSGDRLGQLMGEMRRHLKEQGKELVILFEEFARLQGYDAAMLAALLVQGDDTLCNVRWAVACTSGRFAELPDTVRSRMNGVVDMEAVRPRYDLAAFAGRYLNATRVGRSALSTAYDNPDADVPNACDPCPHRATCHANFGKTPDGFGLYPFTAGAVATMALRADGAALERFNPREFQQRVLQPVLLEGGDALAAGAFPPPSLLAKLGGSHLEARDRIRLQECAGRGFDRYLTLFQLWNDGRLSSLPDGLMKAFGLETIDIAHSEERASEVEGDPQPVTPPPRPRDTKLQLQIRQITAWVEGGYLDQTLAEDLRVAVYQLVEQSIDWDALGLLPTTFAGATANRPFRRQSISFERQATSGGLGGKNVPLKLPLVQDDAGFTRCAQALQALLVHRETGSWEEAGGLEGLAAVLELGDAAAAHVVDQIRALRGDVESWDPVAGAVELLLIGSALAGQLTASNIDDVALLDTIFGPLENECPISDTGVQRLYKKLQAGRNRLQDLVRAHTTGAKGGARGRFIDPSNIVPVLRGLRRRKWVLGRVPQDRPEPYREVKDLYAAVLAELRPGLERERASRLAWLAKVEAAFGEADRQAILGSVTACLDGVAAAGLPVQRAAVDAARDAFAGVQYHAAVEAARRLREADPPEAEILAFARARRGAIEASERLADAWTHYVVRAEAELAAKLREFGGEQVATEAARLRSALAGIAQELDSLEVGDVAA